ncbi:MGDG synthase family glycosyltransferase [Gorillibacterium massiliense]|uniref:MGDG synthase family glycosyltransferase n=1 Tax=Gorillibacterium massiliense TaxID=1280390 RepID=UPI0004B6F4EC|nr:glycosyltransferase [Gorillibacterium massiliense]
MASLQKKKILILCGDLGDGHIQAASAIKQAAKLHDPEVDAEVVNFSVVTHPKLHNVGKYCYTQWITKFPLMYGYLFQKTRDENAFSHLFKKLKFYTLSRLVRLLEDVRPDVIVSTFPGAAAGISMLKENGLTDLPTVTVITDHTDHSYWLHPYTDRYIVASGHVRDALIRHGVPFEQISVTGIPIRSQFSAKLNRDALRAKHNLDPSVPVVLVMGGGFGLIAKECFSTLFSDDILKTMQFIIICGRNEKLRLQLEADTAPYRDRITLKGYVDDIHEWMALADLAITKPGGLTSSEAIALKLPMLLYKPLPGQEKDNASYLIKEGVALEAKSDTELVGHLQALLKNPDSLIQLKENAARLENSQAAYLALDAILHTESVELPHDLRPAVYARA